MLGTAEVVFFLIAASLLLWRLWNFLCRCTNRIAARKRERPLAVQLAEKRQRDLEQAKKDRAREAARDLDRKIRAFWADGKKLIDAKTNGQVDYSLYDVPAYLRTKKPAPGLTAWIAAFPPPATPVRASTVPTTRSTEVDVLSEELPVFY
jgi:hypothetical protein